MEKINNTILQKLPLKRIPTKDTGLDYLKAIQDNCTPGSCYTVMLIQKHKLSFGYFDGKELVLSCEEQPKDKYIVELRLFNEEEELLLTHVKGAYSLRVLKEKAEGYKVDYVDSVARLFGESTAADCPFGFVKLYELGRKITLTVPCMSAKEYFVMRNTGCIIKPKRYYCLVTRSYIEDVHSNIEEEADRQFTGQSGVSCYRYVTIASEDEIKAGNGNG